MASSTDTAEFTASLKLICIATVLFFIQASLADESFDWRNIYKKHQHTQSKLAIEKLRLWVSESHGKNVELDGEVFFRLIQLQLKTGMTTQASITLDEFSDRKNELNSEQLLWLDLASANIALAKIDLVKAKQALENNSELIASALPIIQMYHFYFLGRQKSLNSLYDEAIILFNDAQKIARELDDSHFNVVVLSQLVNIQYYMQQYDKSLATNDEMIRLAALYKDDFFKVFSLSNAMNLYYMKSVEQGTLAEDASTDESREKFEEKQQKFIKKSDDLRDRVLELSVTIGAFKPLLRALVQLQNKHLRENNELEAIKVAKKTVDFAEQYNSEFEKAVSYNNMAIAFRSIERFDEAVDALAKADEVYTRLDHKQSMLWALEDYSIIYQLKGDFEKALEYYTRYHTETMSLIRKTNSEKVLELQKTFESEKNQREIERLNQENLLNASQIESQRIITVFSVALVILTAFGFFFLHSRSKVIAKKNSELDILNSELKKQAVRDPLTKLHNRRFIGEIQDKLASTVVRRDHSNDTNKRKIGLVLMDIDYFKRINDQYGHSLGDEVLIDISNELMSNLRGGDIAVRWGGEEFLIVLFDTDLEGTKKFCDRILKLRNSRDIKTSTHEIKVTVSMGYALLPYFEDDSQALSWDDSVKLVDNLLYLAKEKGRNKAITITAGNSVVAPEGKNILRQLELYKDEEMLAKHGFVLESLEPISE